MGTPWCQGLPMAQVRASAEPKPVTLVMPYYENARFVRRQVSTWNSYPPELKAGFYAIVVDDGSPTAPLTEALEPRPPVGYPLQTYRITPDIRWNWLAARNIGAYHARDGWLLLTDMDHVLPAETLRAVQWGCHDPAVVYAFSRREHDGREALPHSASFLMTRAMFWTIGGYDEALSGHYGTDGEYRRRLAQHAPIRILPEPLIRYEYVEDASTTRYQRKQPQDAAVRRMVAARSKRWRPKVLSFPYHRTEVAGAPC